MSRKLLSGDQERQLERVRKSEPRDFLGRRLGAIRYPRSNARRKIV
jgi:hypothetical protein